MKPEIKKKWVAALRSGKYKQGTRALAPDLGPSVKDSTFCCLGVLSDLFLLENGFGNLPPPVRWMCVDEVSASSGALPSCVAAWAGCLSLDPVVGSGLGTASLSCHNDGQGNIERKKNFKKIADLIEEHL